jgi:hypothetical protein
MNRLTFDTLEGRALLSTVAGGDVPAVDVQWLPGGGAIIPDLIPADSVPMPDPFPTPPSVWDQVIEAIDSGIDWLIDDFRDFIGPTTDSQGRPIYH